MKTYLNLAELEQISWKKIEEMQQLRFRAIAKYILPNVPAYARLFEKYNVEPSTLKKTQDWHSAGLPLIKKSYYMQNPLDFVFKTEEENAFEIYTEYASAIETGEWEKIILKGMFGKQALKHEIKQFFMPHAPMFSGGTESGIPTPVLMTAKQLETMKNMTATIAQMLIREMFKDKRTVGMNLFPYGPHLAWHAAQMALDSADFNMLTAAGGAISTEKLVQLAIHAKPNIIIGMSEYLRNRFLPEAIRQKAKLAEKVLFVNGGGKMHESERKRIRALAAKLGAKETIVLDFFGASEWKEDLMPECREHTGFHHIAPLSTIIRTVSARPCKGDLIEEWDFTNPEDGGYAASWNIGAGGTLLEGYLTGDHIESIQQGNCPGGCKLNVERILGVDRIRDIEAQLMLTGMVEEKVKGARINLSAMRKKLLGLREVAEAQVIARKTKKGHELIARIVPQGNARKALELAQQALKYVEVKPKIELATLDGLTGKKIKFEGIIVER